MCEVGEELFRHDDKERNNAHVEVSILGGEKMSHSLFREGRLKMLIYSCDSLKWIVRIRTTITEQLPRTTSCLVGLCTGHDLKPWLAVPRPGSAMFLQRNAGYLLVYSFTSTTVISPPEDRDGPVVPYSQGEQAVCLWCYTGWSPCDPGLSECRSHKAEVWCITYLPRLRHRGELFGSL